MDPSPYLTPLMRKGFQCWSPQLLSNMTKRTWMMMSSWRKWVFWNLPWWNIFQVKNLILRTVSINRIAESALTAVFKWCWSLPILWRFGRICPKGIWAVAFHEGQFLETVSASSVVIDMSRFSVAFYWFCSLILFSVFLMYLIELNKIACSLYLLYLLWICGASNFPFLF